MFRGHIEWIDSDDDNFRLLDTVVWEDDDREDLDPQEFEEEEVVTLSDDIKGGGIKEWELDNE